MSRSNEFELNQLSPDGRKRCQSPLYEYVLEIVDTESGQILYQKTDYSGHHMVGGFSESGTHIIYLSFDRHWYISPVVTVWDYDRDLLKSVETRHNPQHEHMALACSADFSWVALGGYDGSLSVCKPFEQGVVWHLEQAFSERSQVTGLNLSQREGTIVAQSQGEIRIFSLSDGRLVTS